MKFSMPEVYDTLKRWKADREAMGRWTERDEDMMLAITVLLAEPK